MSMTAKIPVIEAIDRDKVIFSLSMKAERNTTITAEKKVMEIAFANGMNFIEPKKHTLAAIRQNPLPI